jgi:hypothetical protein
MFENFTTQNCREKKKWVYRKKEKKRKENEERTENKKIYAHTEEKNLFMSVYSELNLQYS